MSYENTASTEIPEFVSFTDSDREALSKRDYPRPVEGWMAWEVLSEARGFSKNGHFEIKYKCSPVDTEGQVISKVSSIVKLYLPITNQLREGHTAPNTKLGCYFWAKSTDPNFPAYPKKLKPGVYESAAGEILTGAALDAANSEVNKAIEKSAERWWNERGGMVGKRFYGKNENRLDDQGRVWPEITRTSATPPNAEPLITTNFVAK